MNRRCFKRTKKDSRRSIVVVHDSILGQGFGGGVIRIRDA
jgi:hypothetical protein